ncbi:MAG: CoA transferase [Acidibrevibacterium sp.]|jgi:formyl-CoA transferase|uniref:CaiB/BaiF CoA transferase family protein n=1 Tax=Acidibrevibacterium fodinaquatile TaxID=1969806 RepID=UPI0023A847F7|nr:CaiB/BaiF CoA-transferase family protein [Acidibrevibacterium fodinaquatile]MCA7121086.1 CoA transferase [Acidibrevibacterium fodinaquatile]
MPLPLSPGALAGIKVIDLTRVLGGPYCTMILADHGAEVIKIEPPQGDEVRDWGPPFLDQPDGSRDASYFLGVNRNKRALALDIGSEAGRAVLLRLLDGADVLVENFKPGGMEKWGLGYASLEQRFPGLIHCRVSGFGGEGPLGGLPGYDAILQAMTGLMSVNGDRSTGPLRIGTPVVDLATGLYSAIAILMALVERTRSGRGQFLDMTLHDCAMALLHPQAANYFLNGRRPVATGNPHPNLAPYETYQTRTGQIFIAAGNDGQFRKLCAELGVPDLANDPRFATNADRLTHRAALIAAFSAVLAEADGNALTLRLLRAGLPAGPVRAVDEALANDHTAARGMVADIGAWRGLGTPIKLSRTPGGPRAAPPRFAEHTDAILARHGFSAEEIQGLEKEGILFRQRRK